MADVHANAYKGESIIHLGGADYILCFDWPAIEKVHTEVGPTAFHNMMKLSPSEITKILLAGLHKHHSGTFVYDSIMAMSPPLVPVIQAIDKAVAHTYFGPKAKPDESETVDDKKKP